MTYDELYKPALEEYKSKWKAYFQRLALTNCSGMSIVQLQDELQRRKDRLAELEANKPEFFAFDLVSAVNNHFQTAEDGYHTATEGLRKKAEERKQELDRQRDAAIAAADNDAASSVAALQEKYDTLLTYKDKVAEAVLRYGIKPSGLDIDMSNLSRQELLALLDTSISACKVLGEDKFRNKLKVLYEPPEGADQDQRLYQAIAVIVGVVVLAPIALCVLFWYMYTQTARIHRTVDSLRIADKLMCGINFDKYRDAPKYDAIPPVDYSAIEQELAENLKHFAERDPAKDREALQQEINKNHSQIASDFRNASNFVMTQYTEFVGIWREGVAELEQVVAEYMANIKEFGTYCSESNVLDTNYTLGKEKNVLDVKYDIGLKNLVFKNKTPEMMQFVKLLFTNALLSVRPKQLRCTIYDPEGLGADFATFINQDTMDYVSVVTTDLTKVLDAHRIYSQNNLRILDQIDINTYNKTAEEQDMMPLEYKLLIIASGLDKAPDNKILTEYMQFSARTGVIIWLVAPDPVPNCIFYSRPFESVDSPYPVSHTLFNRAAATYLDAFQNLKAQGILYTKAFADRYLPREKWWQENTDTGIKINCGLQDGDPGKGYPLILGDDNVHALCCGGTGSGKSVFINQMIASLVMRYPPSALELVLVDFKNVEFSALTDTTTHLSRIPHARIIAGTKDGEYAISVFQYLIDEMNRRSRIFAETGAKKLEDYNKKMRAAGQPGKCLPRIAMIVDEFQVMFTEVDAKSVDIIQGHVRSLAKLGRSFGCHLFFVSQSMKGTMPKDIKDQFTMRVVLKCSADASNELIGTNIGAKIKTKGYLYTNLSGGETQDTTRMWRTPFIRNEDLYDTEVCAAKVAAGELPAETRCILDAICQMAEERSEINHKALFYNEEQSYQSDVLVSWLQEHTDVMEREQRLMVLGERTAFSLKTTPVNFKLTRGDGENILFYAFERLDFQNLCMTLIKNIQANPRAKLLINCADQDMFDILDFEHWYEPDLLDIAAPQSDVREWVETLEDMIERRKQQDPSEYTPVYFMCLRWDKQLGICRDENMRLSDTWKSVIREAPSVDIHIIFGVQLSKEVSHQYVSLFNHVICAKGTDDAGSKYIESGKITKLPDTLGFAIYKYGGVEQKFKVYQFEYTRTAETREVVL